MAVTNEHMKHSVESYVFTHFKDALHQEFQLLSSLLSINALSKLIHCVRTELFPSHTIKRVLLESQLLLFAGITEKLGITTV